MKRVFVVLLLCCLPLFICSGETFSREKVLLEKGIKVMGDYADSMNETQDVDTMIKLAEKLTADLGPLLPELNNVIKEHPEWGDDPPQELKDVLDRFMTAQVRMSKALNRLTKVVNNNPDNKKLNKAFSELNMLFYKN